MFLPGVSHDSRSAMALTKHACLEAFAQFPSLNTSIFIISHEIVPVSIVSFSSFILAGLCRDLQKNKKNKNYKKRGNKQQTNTRLHFI